MMNPFGPLKMMKNPKEEKYCKYFSPFFADCGWKLELTLQIQKNKRKRSADVVEPMLRVN